MDSFGCQLSKNDNKKPLVKSQTDFLIHFLIMSRNKQVAMYGYDGQVIF